MPSTVQLFVTCIVDTLYPQVGQAVVRVLGRAGAEIAFPPGQTCCGQPAFNAGLRFEARQMAVHTIRVLEGSPGPVVVPSGSCAAMIRHGYKELFAEDAEWLPHAQALARRTFEFTEYLVDVLGLSDLHARWPARLAYHPSCHLLRELGVSRQPRALLSHIEGAEVLDLPNAEECCGFGGVFSVEYPEISTAMLERKIHNFQQSGANVLVSCDAGCVTQLNGGFHKRGLPEYAMHIAEILEKT